MVFMKWNDTEFMESIRLINKFFPESIGYVTPENGIFPLEILLSMNLWGLFANIEKNRNNAFIKPNFKKLPIDIFEDQVNKGFLQLFEYMGFNPNGRCIVVPDMVKWSKETLKPFTCSTKILDLRIAEMEDYYRRTLG